LGNLSIVNFSDPFLALVLLVSPAGLAGAGQERPASRWSTATDVEMVADERDSLAGISRLAVSVVVPEGGSTPLAAGALASTITFRLEQAGLIVVPTRAVEEPLLNVTLREIVVGAERPGDSVQVAYRLDIDLLQLVRLADRDSGRARLMMASTWHAGTFGTATTAAVAAEARSRVDEVVDTFLADYRAANPGAAPPTAR
jgi:hypothetical protein